MYGKWENGQNENWAKLDLSWEEEDNAGGRPNSPRPVVPVAKIPLPHLQHLPVSFVQIAKCVLVMVESPAFGKEELEDLSRLDR